MAGKDASRPASSTTDSVVRGIRPEEIDQNLSFFLSCLDGLIDADLKEDAVKLLLQTIMGCFHSLRGNSVGMQNAALELADILSTFDAALSQPIAPSDDVRSLEKQLAAANRGLEAAQTQRDDLTRSVRGLREQLGTLPVMEVRCKALEDASAGDAKTITRLQQQIERHAREGGWSQTLVGQLRKEVEELSVRCKATQMDLERERTEHMQALSIVQESAPAALKALSAYVDIIKQHVQPQQVVVPTSEMALETLEKEIARRDAHLAGVTEDLMSAGERVESMKYEMRRLEGELKLAHANPQAPEEIRTAIANLRVQTKQVNAFIEAWQQPLRTLEEERQSLLRYQQARLLVQAGVPSAIQFNATLPEIRMDQEVLDLVSARPVVIEVQQVAYTTSPPVSSGTIAPKSGTKDMKLRMIATAVGLPVNVVLAVSLYELLPGERKQSGMQRVLDAAMNAGILLDLAWRETFVESCSGPTWKGSEAQQEILKQYLIYNGRPPSARSHVYRRVSNVALPWSIDSLFSATDRAAFAEHFMALAANQKNS